MFHWLLSNESGKPKPVLTFNDVEGPGFAGTLLF